MRELNPKENDLLDRVINKPELQPFFFRKLKGLHWYSALNGAAFSHLKETQSPYQLRIRVFLTFPFGQLRSIWLLRARNYPFRTTKNMHTNLLSS